MYLNELIKQKDEKMQFLKKENFEEDIIVRYEKVI